jgi:hypothetical protein
MPFVEGESLQDRLNREKQLSQEDVVKITSEVASALGYAHSRDIVTAISNPRTSCCRGTAVVADSASPGGLGGRAAAAHPDGDGNWHTDVYEPGAGHRQRCRRAERS